MFQFRKRWPALTALAAVVAYASNNYQIGGLENLRIEARPTSERMDPNAANPYAFNSQFQGDIYGNAPFAQMAGALSQEMGPQSPPWSHQLSLAEKFSVWQSNRDVANAQATAVNADQAGDFPSLPISTPISVPAGLSNSTYLGSTEAANTLPANPVPNSVFSTSTQQSAALDVGIKGVENGHGQPTARRLRVASFSLQALGPAKLAKPELVELLVRILRQYEVVALQEITSSRDDILPLLVERLNQSGRSYDYLIGPRVGSGNGREQFAFIFDTTRVETDRYQLYTVDDPENLVTYDPLVAWFRCTGVPKDRAFTFSVVNIRIDPARASSERELLPNLIQAIEHDGRQEDDWLIVGDFYGGNAQLPHLNRESVRFAFTDIPTDVMGQSMRSMILFSARGTTEFTGRAGVFDFLQKYNLSLERALEVSEQMPVWVEFSTLEGVDPGRIAPVDPNTVY